MAQLSNKMTVGAGAATAVGTLVAVLFQAVPWLSHAVPAAEQPLIAALAAALAAAVGGYTARHYPAADEVLTEAVKVLTELE